MGRSGYVQSRGLSIVASYHVASNKILSEETDSHGKMIVIAFQYDDDFSIAADLPHCSTLTEAELASMTDCDNSTIVEEVRLRDPLFERLFSQLWHDHQVNPQVNF